RSELQDREGVLDPLATDEVHDTTSLHRSDADVLGGRARRDRGRQQCLIALRFAHRRLLFRSSLTWLLNVLVGADSPSLCPTMFSETNTGACLRPSWPAKVGPMKSGVMVERRDQVLMTCFVPFSFCTSTFAWRWSSTNGPFLRLRGISYLLLQRFLPVLRRRTMSLSLGRLGLRVRPSG